MRTYGLLAMLLSPLLTFAGEASLVQTQDPADPGSAAFSAMSTVSRGSFRSVLQPAIDLSLSARAAGVVHKIHVPEGERIKAGQAIMTLDSDQEKADVDQAEASVRGAKAEMDRAAAEFDRIRQLRESEVSSQKQFIDARAQAEFAHSRYDQSVAALESARVRLANRSIVSPIDGIFFKTNKLIGEAVERYETVARVIDITTIEMVVFCDGKFFSRFRAGQRVEVRVFKSPEEQPIVSGVVYHLDPIVDPSNGTFRVKIKIDRTADVVPGFVAFLIAPAL